MLLGDNYGVTIHKNSGGTTATPFSNKVSVEILDCVFFQISGFYRQASNRYTSKIIKTTVQLVTGVHNLYHRISHLISLPIFISNFKKLQKLKSAF